MLLQNFRRKDFNEASEEFKKAQIVSSKAIFNILKIIIKQYKK